MKVKVLEVEATKLDKNCEYLLVFQKGLVLEVDAVRIMNNLREKGVSAEGLMSIDPENSLKIYAIPKKEK